MNPNLLLLITTVTAYALQVMTSSVYGQPDQAVKYVALALVCPMLFLVLNGWMMKRQGRQALPLVRSDAPSSALWAGIFPLLILICAAVPVMVPGHDYGILVVVTSVWVGVVLQSALAARRGED